ncbi:MAG: hypothetical protein IPI67_41835 [Myxococcales bacterium]|nr:hypothetical protein [Myxococcales bacterium]
MGASSTSLQIERMDSDSGAEPTELATALWDAMVTRFAVLAPNDWPRLEYYANETASEALDEGVWCEEDDSLELIFAQGSCSSSADRTIHFIEHLLAREGEGLNERVALPLGFRLTWEPIDAFELARHSTFPQVFVAGCLYDLRTLTIGNELRAPIWYYGRDGGEDAPFDSLAPDERTRVKLAAVTGQCTCEPCMGLRAEIEVPSERADRDLLEAFAAMAGDDVARALCREAAEPVRAFGQAAWRDSPRGPPALAALSQHLRARGLEPGALALSGLVTVNEPEA